MAGSGRTSNSAVSSPIPTISLNTSEPIPEAIVDAPTTHSGHESAQISPEQESEPPEFSVEYNPEVTRALTLHLEHVFMHENPAWCMKISPNGQGMAIGFDESGAAIISDMKTRSNVRSVSEFLAVL